MIKENAIKVIAYTTMLILISGCGKREEKDLPSKTDARISSNVNPDGEKPSIILKSLTKTKIFFEDKELDICIPSYSVKNPSTEIIELDATNWAVKKDGSFVSLLTPGTSDQHKIQPGNSIQLDSTLVSNTELSFWLKNTKGIAFSADCGEISAIYYGVQKTEGKSLVSGVDLREKLGAEELSKVADIASERILGPKKKYNSKHSFCSKVNGTIVDFFDLISGKANLTELSIDMKKTGHGCFVGNSDTIVTRGDETAAVFENDRVYCIQTKERDRVAAARLRIGSPYEVTGKFEAVRGAQIWLTDCSFSELK